MKAVGQTLWDHIETTLIGSTNTATDWTNTLDDGVVVDEANINEMVQEKFAGGNKSYDGIYAFTNGTKQYKLKAKPLQNKTTRETHRYGEVRRGGENKVNIVAYPAADGANVFNLHIQVRKARYARPTVVVDADGFTRV